MGGAREGWGGTVGDGWGEGVMGKHSGRWVGRGSDWEAQWAIGGARA